jgi:SAM-dependent methyltransferase
VSASYDRIGVGYSITRRTDPRIEARIVNALGDVGSVANVGAGAGSYEPRGPHLRVVAVEPSAVMIRQRAPGAPPVIQAVAEALPLATGGVDAALAILTVHHWTDPRRGLAEMRRVARKRVVIFTWDQDAWESFWLIREYLPCIRDLDRPRAVAVAEIRSVLGPCRVLPVPIPFDCRDGFHGAFWRRPEAYLDPRVRTAISTYAAMPARERDQGLERLCADIESGRWTADHGNLLDLEELDLGYRLIVVDL